MENNTPDHPPETPAKKGRRSKRDGNGDDGKKRRCISSACVPCRKRKSKVRNANLAVRPFSGGSLNISG
jgi:hypothetical protein